MQKKKYLMPIMAFAISFSTIFSIPATSEAACFFDSCFAEDFIDWVTGGANDVSSSSSSDDSSDASEGVDDNDSYSVDTTTEEQTEAAQTIATYMTQNGTLPPNAKVVGRKKDKQGNSYIAITTEAENGKTVNVVLEVDKDNGAIELPSDFTFKDDESKSMNQAYQDIVDNGGSDLSEAEVNELNDELHNTKFESMASKLGISEQTAAAAAMGGISAIGLAILGAGKGKEEQEQIAEEIKENIEEGKTNYEDTQAMVQATKDRGTTFGGLYNEEDFDRTMENIFKEQTSAANPTAREAVRLSPVDLARISNSIANMPNMATMCDASMLQTIKNYIASTNGDWYGENLEKLASNIIMYSKENKINPLLITAQIRQESGFNPRAGSSAGAMGISQFIQSTADSFGINPWDVTQSIDGMCRYMGELMTSFHDEALALAGYNAGGGAVEKYGGIPPYSETQNYVSRISSIIADLTDEYNKINAQA